MYPSHRFKIPSSKIARRWLATAVFAAGASAIAFAQSNMPLSESASPAREETQEPKDDIVVMERFTVAGTGMAMDSLKYPGSVSVLTSGDLVQHADIIQSLSQVPGFETGGDNGRSIGQQFCIRGFGYQSEDRVIIEQDGVRRSANLFSNQVSSFRADTDLLKQVEVVKGASSNMHGGGAIGGMVSMTTKDAADYVINGNTLGAEVKLRYESNGVAEGSVGAAMLGKGFAPEIVAYFKYGYKGDLKLADSFKDYSGNMTDEIDNDEDMRTYFVKAAWRPASRQRLVFSYYRYEEDTETTWQTLWGMEYSPATGPVIGSLKQDDFVARYEIAPDHLPWLNLTANIMYSEAGYDRGYSYVDSEDGPIRLDYENADQRKGVKLENLSRWKTGPVTHRTLAGLDYQRREEDAIYVLNGEQSDFGSMPNKYDDFGAYVQEEASMLKERLVFQIGGRFDSFDREVPHKGYKYNDTHFSPRAGMNFEILRGLCFLGNYSESFRAPTPHETYSEGALNPAYHYLPNPNLKPELAREFETGLSFQRENLITAGDILRAKAVWFYGRISDMIDIVPDLDGETPPDARFYATYGNVGKVNRRGVEVEVSYAARHWTARASYEMLDMEDAKTGEKAPSAFADKIQLGLGLRPFRENLVLNIGMEHWLPPRQNPAGFISRQVYYEYVTDDYTIVNASLSWKPTNTNAAFLDNKMEFRIGVNNLFNASRLEALDTVGSATVGLGTNVFVSVLKRF